MKVQVDGPGSGFKQNGVEHVQEESITGYQLYYVFLFQGFGFQKKNYILLRFE